MGVLGGVDFEYKGCKVNLGNRASGHRLGNHAAGNRFILSVLMEADVNVGLLMVHKDYCSANEILVLGRKSYVEVDGQKYYLRSNRRRDIETLLMGQQMSRTITKLLTYPRSALSISRANGLNFKGQFNKSYLLYKGIPRRVYKQPEICQEYLDMLLGVVDKLKQIG